MLADNQGQTNTWYEVRFLVDDYELPHIDRDKLVFTTQEDAEQCATEARDALNAATREDRIRLGNKWVVKWLGEHRQTGHICRFEGLFEFSQRRLL